MFDIPPTEVVERAGSSIREDWYLSRVEMMGGWVVTISRRQVHQSTKGLSFRAPLVVELES